MEAIAAFSLACNVVQIVEAGINVASVIHQTYKDGASKEHVDLAGSLSHFESLSNSLQTSLRIDIGNAPFSSEEIKLQDIAKECDQISAKLCAELSKLEARSRRREALIKGFRAWRKKDDIERLKFRLQDYERMLNTSLLITLRRKHDATKVLQSAEFQSLNITLQRFIQDVASGLLDCSSLVRDEAEATRHLINQTRDQILTRIDDRDGLLQAEINTGSAVWRLLDSLTYPEMNARMNQVTKSEEETFKWVFDSAIKRPWSSFTEWLSAGEGVYWVQGKAGSGKSTLMKFITDHHDTPRHLAKWSNQRGVTTLSAYLWLSGTQMQRSLLGLLCSLLHQAISVDKTIVHTLLKTRPQLAHKKNIHDWSFSEAFEILLVVVKARAQQNPVCIFLDGLDELDKKESPEELRNCIVTLIEQKQVKFCVSSRPEQFWVDQFKQRPRLRLQDLTKADIACYATKHLSPYLNFTPSGQDEDLEHPLVWKIVRKADGVFLWVTLATNALIRGLTAQANEMELQNRIDQLPSDLEELYHNMLSRAGEDWAVVRQEAALYLYLCLFEADMSTTLEREIVAKGPRLYHYMLVEYYWRHEWQDRDPDYTSSEFYQACDRTVTRLTNTTMGMLEVSYWMAMEKTEETLSDFQRACGVVSFSHRTVRDFLVDKPAGQSIITCSPLNRQIRYQHCLRAELCCYKLGIFELDWEGITNIIRLATRYRLLSNTGHHDSSYVLTDFFQSTEILIYRNLSSKPSAQTVGMQSQHLEDSRRIQYQLRQQFSKSNPFSDHQWPFDVLGLSLSGGLTCYFDGAFPSLSSRNSSLMDLTTAYREYLLICVGLGLTGMLSACQHNSGNAALEMQRLVSIAYLLRDAGTGLDVLTHIGISSLIEFSGCQIIVSVLPKHEDERPIAKDLTIYLTRAVQSNRGTHAELYSTNKSIIPATYIMIAMQTEDYLEFCLMYSSSRLQNDGIPLSCMFELRCRDILWLCSMHASDKAYKPSMEGSRQIIEDLNTVFGNYLLTKSTNWVKVNRELNPLLVKSIYDCIQREDTETVEITQILYEMRTTEDEGLNVNWAEQIPMYKERMAEVDPASSQARVDEDSPESETDCESFRSFEQ